MIITVSVNGVAYDTRGRAAPAAQRLHPPGSRADRHARRLRARRLRRVHRSSSTASRRARASCSRSRPTVTTSHRGRAGVAGRRAEPAAGRLPRRARPAVRLLHARDSDDAHGVPPRHTRRPSEPEIRDALSANLCRCTGYQHIVEAVTPCLHDRPATLATRVPRQRGRAPAHRPRLFVDDVQLPGMLHVAFVRSDYAHGRMKSVDVSEAARTPGCGGGLHRGRSRRLLRGPAPLLVPPPPIPGLVFHARTQLPLAAGQGPLRRRTDRDDRRREPLRCRRRAARRHRRHRAARRGRRSRSGARRRCAAGARASRRRTPRRKWCSAKATMRRARASADVVIKRRFLYDRGASAAIENRAVVAQWDRQAEELTIWDTTQAPIPIRNGLAQMLGLLESQVRVIAPFVGGGFGPKIMMFYPEELLVPWAAMRLGRPAEVDRGPPGELLRHDAGARPGARRGDGAVARRPHPRRARHVPVRHRRLRSRTA